MSSKCGIPFSAALLHPKYWPAWLGLGTFAIVSLLPRTIRHATGRQIGKTIFNSNQKRRNTSLKNIHIAFPHLNAKEQEAMALKQLQYYGCAMMDYSLPLFASKKRLSKLIAIDGKEHIDTALETNKNIIILLAHSSFLEFAPAALAQEYSCFGSYKNARNAVLDWVVAKSRCRHVEFLVSREQGLRKLIKAIQPGKLMIFLPDEDLGIDNAVFAPFFGKQKATLSTTARMAKMAKATALPAFSFFDEKSGKYRLKIGAALENYPSADAVKDATTMNQGLEKLISEHPEQYMWFLKLFRTRPEGDTFKY